MTEENRLHQPEAHLEHPEVRYERTDAGFRVILGVAVASILLGMIICGALLWFQFHYAAYLTKIRETSFPVAAQQREQLPPGPGSHPLNGGSKAGQRELLPPEPRLDPINVREGVRTANVAELYARDTEILHSYGSTQGNEFIHIPIERAMALLEGKLPVRAEPASDKKHDQGLRDWGEPNSGRLFRGQPR